MPVKNYYTVNGRIIGEKTAGGSRVDYLSDALGNVTGTVDQSANVINTYRYKPYGELLAKTGSGSDPSFGWVGTLGYRKTSRRFSEQYVRARHYGTSQGQWTTVDPWWPNEPAFNYCYGDPATALDPLGTEGYRDAGESRPNCEPLPSKCCCCPVDITPVNKKEYRVANVSLPKWDGRYFKDFVGMTFDMLPKWKRHTVGGSPPADMPPCNLTWAEETKLSLSKFSDSIQYDIWNYHCPQRSKCNDGNCPIWDAPGLNNFVATWLPQVRRRKQKLQFDVCIRVGLSSSCAKGDCNPNKVDRIYKFELHVAYPYNNAKASVTMSLSGPHNSCTARPLWK